jgi:hypothetical protein
MAGAVGVARIGSTAAGLRARRCVLVALVAVLAVLAGCGEDGNGGGEGGAPWIDPDGELPIVGSIAVNPRDKALWLATNTGLFRVPPGGGAPRQVTGTLSTPKGSGKISEQLVVRFTGPDQLLGSGHPPPGDTDLPQLLGLIRSTDAGKTWSSVSQLNAGDFHAIERSGGLLVGSQFGLAQILVSRDEGEKWSSRASPGALVDLELDPGDPQRWIASTAESTFRSEDEGRTWRAIDPTPNSRFAWPAPDALYRLDPGGPLKVSADGGKSWKDRGSTGGEPQALVGEDPETLFALLLDGTVKRSEDGGRTWSVLVAAPA